MLGAAKVGNLERTLFPSLHRQRGHSRGWELLQPCSPRGSPEEPQKHLALLGKEREAAKAEEEQQSEELLIWSPHLKKDTLELEKVQRRSAKMMKGPEQLPSEKQTEAERQKIVWEWQELRGFLEEQEQRLLSRLEELERAIVQRRDEGVCSLSWEISLLSERGGEKGQQPLSQPLQGAGSTVGREDGTFRNPEPSFTELEKRLSDFSLKSAMLQEVLLGFKETLQRELGSDTGYRLMSTFCSRSSHPPRGKEMASMELAQSVEIPTRETPAGSRDSPIFYYQALASRGR
ncbi:E3 ubiquitin-protein ligase TRIM7-like isoform X2 [Gopherus evgoodei]|uniref:E3 ubiquitin-protein ligase TRIM7-like isoform X2 n=1 Tax=Gopherus evgoodei TaxID=1825980 RepID=UPI0011CFF2C9|nr:E3 ubiquitin-protein ligase TRIM7-like isoform X2 [Gopherus evgoodei]